MALWDSVLKSIGKTDLKGWGDLLSGGAAAYGAYKQGEMASKLAKLQLKDYEDEKKRKKNTQNNINSAYSARLPLTTK